MVRSMRIHLPCFAVIHAVILLALNLSFTASYAREPTALDWQDDFQTRLEAYALMQTLNVEILGSSSATRSLEKWCNEHRLAPSPSIIAHPVDGEGKTATQEQLQRLDVSDPEQVKHRKVRLYCGNHLLSEADNWYVPSRLTEAMNRLLETTTTPFGKVIASLEPTRQTFSVKLFWSPLPEGWELQPHFPVRPGKTQPLVIPDALFEHQAIVYSRDRKPLAEVHEVYQGQILRFRRAGFR